MGKVVKGVSAAKKPIVVKHPGALHKALGVAQGKNIPDSKIKAAEKQPGKVGAEARFAANVLHATGKK